MLGSWSLGLTLQRRKRKGHLSRLSVQHLICPLMLGTGSYLDGVRSGPGRFKLLI